MKFSYKIWDKKEFIGNGSPEYVINEYKIGEEDNIILVLDDMNKPCEIHKENDVRLRYGLSETLTIEDVGLELVKRRTFESSMNLEDAYYKISILESENIALRSGLEAVLRGDMQSLAYALYPQDFNNINRNNTTLEL